MRVESCWEISFDSLVVSLFLSQHSYCIASCINYLQIGNVHIFLYKQSLDTHNKQIVFLQTM